MSTSEKFLLGAHIWNAAWMIEIDETFKVIPAFFMVACWATFLLVDGKKDWANSEE